MASSKAAAMLSASAAASITAAVQKQLIFVAFHKWKVAVKPDTDSQLSQEYIQPFVTYLILLTQCSQTV